MRRILFVDDELQILESLRDSLRKQRSCWEMMFVSSAQAALAELENRPFDIVVSDMQMPVTDGATLLAQIRDRYPRTLRLILSGEADEETILRALPIAHQFLSKPCDPVVLRQTLERLCALLGLEDDHAIRAMLGEPRVPPSFRRP
jgi:DNA-binding NtrC family response regulator